MTWGGFNDLVRQRRRHRFELFGCRPVGRRWSEFVVGRIKTLSALERDGVVTVSAYGYEGAMRYSDPVKPGGRAGPRVVYRVRVKLKCEGAFK